MGLHGGLLVTFADKIGATANDTIRTEISILDLPSVSGTTRIEANPLSKIRPSKRESIKPTTKVDAKRIGNSAEPTKKAKSLAVENQAKRLNSTNNAKTADQTEASKNTAKIIRQPVTAKTIAKPADRTGPLKNDHVKTKSVESEKLALVETSGETVSKAQPVTARSSATPNESIKSIPVSRTKITPNNNAQPVKITKQRSLAKLSTKASKTLRISKSVKIPDKIVSKTTVPTVIAVPKAQAVPKVPKIPAVDSVTKSQVKPIIPTKLTDSKAVKIRPGSKPVMATKAVRTNNVNNFVAGKKLNTAKRVNRVSRKPTARSKPVYAASKPTIAVNSTVGKVQAVSRPIKSAPVRISTVKSVRAPPKTAKPATDLQPDKQVAMITRPNLIPTELRPSPTKNQVEGFGKVMNFLKFHRSENKCFLALPKVSNQDRMKLIGFSNERNSWSKFQKSLEQDTNYKVPGHLTNISDAQCDVMTFARKNQLYPSFTVSMLVDRPIIGNGEFVSGKLFINEGRILNLFLIDDEGIAININRLIDLGSNSSSFKMQVNLTGGDVNTAQLLLAIVSDQLLDSTRSHKPVPAKQLLESIQLETVMKSLKLDLALSAFVVR